MAGSAGTGAASGYNPPYAPDFALNQPIPSGIAADPRSDAIIERLDLNTGLHKVSVSNYLDDPPVYVVSPSDPFYDLTFEGETIRFRVPGAAVQGGGSDAPVELLDPDHPDYGPFTELRMWQAGFDHAGQGLSASGAGQLQSAIHALVLRLDRDRNHG